MGENNSNSDVVNDGESTNPNKKAGGVAKPPRKCLGMSPV